MKNILTWEKAVTIAFLYQDPAQKHHHHHHRLQSCITAPELQGPALSISHDFTVDSKQERFSLIHLQHKTTL